MISKRKERRREQRTKKSSEKDTKTILGEKGKMYKVHRKPSQPNALKRPFSASVKLAVNRKREKENKLTQFFSPWSRIIVIHTTPIER